MTGNTGKKSTAGVRIFGMLFLAVVLIGSTLVGFMASGGFESTTEPGEAASSAGAFELIVIGIVMGVFFTGAGLGLYILSLLTQCLTFSYRKPIWSGFKLRIFLLKIIVVAGLTIGVGALGSALVGPVLLLLGVPDRFSYLIPFLAAFLILQLITIWVDIWTPAQRTLIRKRLAALGVPEEDIKRGMAMGISNPDKSSVAKLIVEDDIGMLWFEPDHIVYRGDNKKFRITREELVQVERKANAASTSSMAGAQNVILHVQRDRQTRRVRLHPEDRWTLGGTAKASDDLHDRILRWQNPPAMTESPQPSHVQPSEDFRETAAVYRSE